MPEKKKKEGISAGDHSIVIGGNVQGSNIISGNNNTVGIQNVDLDSSFKTIYHYVENHPTLMPGEKEEAKGNLEEVKTELEETKPDEDFLTRRFKNLKRMAPDIVDVAFETLKNPASGVATIIQKIAKKMAE